MLLALTQSSSLSPIFIQSISTTRKERGFLQQLVVHVIATRLSDSGHSQSEFMTLSSRRKNLSINEGRRSQHSDADLNPLFWQNDIIVEVLEDFRVLRMHRNEHFRLHGFYHFSYLIVIQVPRRVDVRICNTGARLNSLSEMTI